jgi:hypothetical protein
MIQDIVTYYYDIRRGEKIIDCRGYSFPINIYYSEQYIWDCDISTASKVLIATCYTDINKCY